MRVCPLAGPDRISTQYPPSASLAHGVVDPGAVSALMPAEAPAQGGYFATAVVSSPPSTNKRCPWETNLSTVTVSDSSNMPLRWMQTLWFTKYGTKSITACRLFFAEAGVFPDFLSSPCVPSA